MTWQLAETVLPLLGERRTAYDIQVGAIPAVVRMQLRGILLDTTAHAALIAALKAERARLDRRLRRGVRRGRPAGPAPTGVPDNAPAIEALLTELLTEQEQQDWPRTPKSGKLSTRRVDLAAGAAAYPLLKTLVDIGRIEKQLNTYGARLAAQISPITGRIHASYRVAGAISGRSTCSKPNMQNIPDAQPVEGLPSFRTLFVARPGYVFVAGRLVLDGDAGGRVHRGGRDHDAGLRARRRPARAHRPDHARARRGRLAGACPRRSASSIASTPSR